MEKIKVATLVYDKLGWDDVTFKYNTLEISSELTNLSEITNVVKNNYPNYYSFEYRGQRIVNEKYLKLKGIIK